MRILIIGGVRPFHKKIMELGHSCVLLMPVAASDPSDLKAPYESVHAFGAASTIDDYVALAESLHERSPFASIVAFHEDFQKLAAPIARKIGLSFLSEEAVLNAADKFRMRERLKASGVDSAASYVVRTREEAASAIKQIAAPSILKPIDGTGSERIFKLENALALPLLPDSLFAEDRTYVVEPFFEGPEYSVEFFSENAQHRLLAITEKHKDPATFVEIGHVVPAPINAQDATLISEYCKAVLNALGMTEGPSHTELVLTAEGPRIIETHTRAGGDGIVELVQLASGIDLISLVSRQSMGERVLHEIPEKIHYTNAAAVWYAAPTSHGKVIRIAGIDAAKSGPGIHDVRILKSVGSVLEPMNHSFKRSACAFAAAPTATEAIASARASLEQLTFEVEC